MSDDKPIDRRRFFRAGLAELLKPLAKAARPLEQIADGLSKLDAPPESSVRSQTRAPRRGAAAGSPPLTTVPTSAHPARLEEQKFRDTCSRCGDCVRACPVEAIQLDPTAREGAGFPYIDTAIAACVMCEELACMGACPTGALMPTPRDRIDMGTAFWNQQLCLRTNGEPCTRCIDFCPVGESALALEENRIQVKPACTGCGLCQHQCPTDPKSIIVIPKSIRRGA